MAGCLQKTADGKTFMLIVNNEISVEFTRSSVDLLPLVGQRIEITGLTDTRKEARNGGQQNGHYMTVSAVKTISSSCS